MADDRAFAPGSRLAAFDVVILITDAVSAVAVGATHFWLGVAIAFVVGHFFLFCNVLRMSRPLELMWAAVFVLFAAAAIMGRSVSWPMVFAISTFVTLVVADIESRRRSYHGVGWRYLNPQLQNWWQSQEKK